MAQLEYGDYYKFFVSCGIALIIVALGFPWLFLHEPFDLLLENSKLTALTPLAKDVVAHRQSIVAWILTIIPFLSPVIFAAGVFMVVWGLWNWSIRQTVRDKSEDLGVKKQERELEDMTMGEVKAKALDDVLVQNVDATAIFGVTAPQTAATNPELQDEANSYLEREAAFLNVLESHLSEEYTIIRHQRSSAYIIDAVLRPKVAGKPQYMIEFTELASHASTTTVISAIQQISSAADWVGFGDQGRYIPIVIAVSGSISPAWVAGANQYLERLSDNPTAVGRSLVRFIMNRKVETLSRADVQRILSTFERVLTLGTEFRKPEDGIHY